MATLYSYNITDAITNTTFEGVEFTVTFNTLPLDLTGADIKMNVVNKKFINSQNYQYSVGNGITITDAVNGVFTFDEQIITIPSGLWKYDITFHLADGSVHTLIKGDWTILENL
jgi:hypothetical protein